MDIDLNPIRGLSMGIDEATKEVDYKRNVYFRWNAEKYDSLGRRSDFLGYVVIKHAEGDTTDSSYRVVTVEPVKAANYYYDDWWDIEGFDTASAWIYEVAAVDRAHNFCGKDTIRVVRSRTLKPGFPLYVGGTAKMPFVGDYDRDGLSEIYSVRHTRSYVEQGDPIGFRGNGQEALVKGPNDGRVENRQRRRIKRFLAWTPHGYVDKLQHKW